MSELRSSAESQGEGARTVPDRAKRFRKKKKKGKL